MALPTCECLPGLYPNWKALGPIVAAARSWAGESPDLACYEGRPISQQLSALYCAVFAVAENGPAPGPTLLASIDIADPDNIEAFARSVVAGYTGVDEVPFGQQALANVLRGAHYIDGEPTVLLEDVPTPPAGGSSATDDFEEYSDGALLESTDNWAAVNGSMIVGDNAGTKYVKGNTLDTVCVSVFTAVSFLADAISECTIESFGALASGVACACDIMGQEAYHCFVSDGQIYLGVLQGGVGSNYVDTVNPISAGGRLRMWKTGSGASTRVNVEVNNGGGWVAVWTDQDLGIYLSGTGLGVCSFSNTSDVSHISTWSGYDQ